MLVVRELTGGLYYGEPRGIAADGSSAHNTMRYSRHEIERIARRAFDAARLRRKRVTSVDKANVLETSRLWRAGRQPRSRGLSGRQARSHARRLVRDAHRARAGQLRRHRDREHVRRHPVGRSRRDRRLARPAAVGKPRRDGPGLFEPVHGSAPDIAGQNIANPIGAIGSAAMLLRMRWGWKPRRARSKQPSALC